MNAYERNLQAFGDAELRSPSFGRLTDKLVLIVVLIASVPACFDLGREAAAGGLGFLVITPLLVVWRRTGNLLVADPVLIIGTMWCLSAATPPLMPTFYSDSIWNSISDPSYDAAVLWMYRAWAACSIAYWLVRVNARVIRPATPFAAVFAREDRLRWLVGLAGFVGSVGTTILTRGQGYTFGETRIEASSFGMIFHELKQFAVIYIFLHFHARGRGRLTRNERWLLMAVLAAQALIVVAAGSKGVIMEMLAAWMIGNVTSKSRVGLLKELGLGVLAFATIYATFNLVAFYRVEMTERAVRSDLSYGEALSIQLESVSIAVSKTLSGQSAAGAGNEASHILDRFAYVSALATLFDQTGGTSPYENALQSAIAPIYALIPRDIVGEKVQFFGSGEFAQMLGWTAGGFSVTLPGSFFWAWGYEGIVAGMALLGAVLAIFFRFQRDVEGVKGLIYRALMFRQVALMLDVGMDFQTILISLTRSLAFLLVLVVLSRYLLVRRRMTWPPRTARR